MLEIATPRVLDESRTKQLEAIYKESFPERLRADLDELLRGVENKTRDLFIATSGNQLLGFGILLPLRPVRILLLEYMAMRSDQRNRGFGGSLFESFIQHSESSRDSLGLVFEVEENDKATPAERTLQGRRVRFYRRHGATPVECAPKYRIPAFDSTGSHHLRLMWRTTSDLAKLSGDLLRDCLRHIFKLSYGRETHDELLQRNLRELAC
jgi:GNAT superfamily N-acetyltransferase